MDNLSSVYKITNKITGRFYIGCSTNVERRFNQHRQRYKDLNSGEYNKPLYIDMRKYGIDNFTFEVLETCQDDKRFELEQQYINNLNAYIEGYNTGHNGEAHGNTILTEKEVADIRNRYNNHERYRDVYKLYSDKISESGFSKIWKGETWLYVNNEVYTDKNKIFHKHNTGNPGSLNGRSLISEDDVIYIRTCKKEGKRMDDVYQKYKHTFSKGYFKNIWYGQTWPHIKV